MIALTYCATSPNKFIINLLLLKIQTFISRNIGIRTRTIKSKILYATNYIIFQYIFYIFTYFERMNRIELSSSAWDADALPLCYTRINKPIVLELPQTVK